MWEMWFVNYEEIKIGGWKALQGAMSKVLCWNVRGLNSPIKQRVVRDFISTHATGLVSLLETKVKVGKMGNLYLRVCPGWCFTCNSQYHNGGRIIVMWNPHFFNVTIVCCTSQLIHCYIEPKVGKAFYGTFVYAFNDAASRKALWRDLVQIQSLNEAWVWMGDFNNVLNMDERVGAPVRATEIMDFRRYVEQCSMEDMKATGCFYTWNNKQEAEGRVYSKLDRVMCN